MELGTSVSSYGVPVGLPSWLFENLTNSGYWTSIAYALDSLYAWGVGSDGTIYYNAVYNGIYGVRPVITLSK